MSKEYQDNPINGDEHVQEQLSDYMDGLLAGEARDTVRSHLEMCADCRADYIELRATRKLMQNMPAVAASRAFTLTPEMAGQVRKTSFWEGFFGRQNAPRLATGSLVALLLFLIIGNDFLGKANSQSAPSAMMVTSSQSVPSVSSGDASQPPSVSGAGGQAQAAPTNTTAPSAPSPAQSSSLAQDQTPHTDAAVPQSTATAPQSSAPIAPQENSTSGENSSGGSGQLNVRPNGVTASGNSSPTTTTLNETPGAYDYTKSAIPPPAASSSDNSSTGWVILQIGLLALGLGLGVAAFIAWRRS